MLLSISVTYACIHGFVNGFWSWKGFSNSQTFLPKTLFVDQQLRHQFIIITGAIFLAITFAHIFLHVRWWSLELIKLFSIRDTIGFGVNRFIQVRYWYCRKLTPFYRFFVVKSLDCNEWNVLFLGTNFLKCIQLKMGNYTVYTYKITFSSCVFNL